LFGWRNGNAEHNLATRATNLSAGRKFFRCASGNTAAWTNEFNGHGHIQEKNRNLRNKASVGSIANNPGRFNANEGKKPSHF
jgi:hypothetical protein